MTTPIEPSSEIEQILDDFYDGVFIEELPKAKAAIERLITAARVDENERYMEMLRTGKWRSFATEVNERLAQLTNRDGGDDGK